MNKMIIISILITALLTLSGCTAAGRVNGSGRLIGSSELFTEKEIAAAMDETSKYFKYNFRGCDLIGLYYDESKSAPAAEEWAQQYQADEAIVLLSDFDAGAKCSGGLQPNNRYINWQWVLVRDAGEQWQMKTCGY